MTDREIAVRHKFGWTSGEGEVTIHYQILNPQEYKHNFGCRGTILGARKNPDESHNVEVRIIK